MRLVHFFLAHQKMYNHVLPCTAMYCHEQLPCTAMYSQSTYSVVLVRTFGHLSVPVRTGMHLYEMSCENLPKVHIGTYTTRVQGGTYWYILVCTVMPGMYHHTPVHRIPDGGAHPDHLHQCDGVPDEDCRQDPTPSRKTNNQASFCSSLLKNNMEVEAAGTWTKPV
jgi:hypothetical protein